MSAFLLKISSKIKGKLAQELEGVLVGAGDPHIFQVGVHDVRRGFHTGVITKIMKLEIY